MAADIKFRLLADDSDITSTTHQLTPYILYRGMAVYQEYHEIYVKNEGANELVDPAHTMANQSYPGSSVGATANKKQRKVTGSAKDGGSTDTIYIDYGGESSGSSWGVSGHIWGPTAIPDTANEMAVGRCYDLWTKYKAVSATTAIGQWSWRHSIGGTEP